MSIDLFQLFFFQMIFSFQFPLFLLHLNSDPTLISGFLVKLDFVLCDSHCISCCGYFLCDFLSFFISLFFFFNCWLSLVYVSLTGQIVFCFLLDFCVFFGCVCMCFGHTAWHLGSNFSTKNGTRTPSSGSMES